VQRKCIVAVFAGATNTPLACTVMAVELFGGAGVAKIARTRRPDRARETRPRSKLPAAGDENDPRLKLVITLLPYWS